MVIIIIMEISMELSKGIRSFFAMAKGMNKIHLFFVLPPFTFYFILWYLWKFGRLLASERFFGPLSEDDEARMAKLEKSLPIAAFAAILSLFFLMVFPQNRFLNDSAYESRTLAVSAYSAMKSVIAERFPDGGAIGVKIKEGKLRDL